MRLDKERTIPAVDILFLYWPHLWNAISGAGKTADEYINSMAKSASPDELRMMRGQPTEAMKMTMFYRYWVRSQENNQEFSNSRLRTSLFFLKPRHCECL